MKVNPKSKAIAAIVVTGLLAATILTVLVMSDRGDTRARCDTISEILDSGQNPGQVMKDSAIHGVIGSADDQTLRAECPEVMDRLDGVNLQTMVQEPGSGVRGDVDRFSADNELAFASTDQSCDDLRRWYDANPGDSNPTIATQFYDKCDTLPPPVESGELEASDVGYVPEIDVTFGECTADPYFLDDIPYAAFEALVENNTTDPVRIELVVDWSLGGESQTFKKKLDVAPDGVQIFGEEVDVTQEQAKATPVCEASFKIL